MKLNTTYRNVIMAVIAIFCFTSVSNAQMSPTSVVNTYGDIMTKWCNSDDEVLRQQIEGLTSGGKDGISCRVDDGLKPLLAKKFEDVNPNISLLMDTYLNKLSLCVEEDGLTFKHDNPEWQKDYKEPIAFESKDDLPVQFASMDFTFSGGLDFHGKSLFFVRGNQITYIVDFKGGKSLAEGLRLYSARKYDEAFNIFRSLSYEEPSNYAAQYYTTVMEIKNQGCSNLGKKVRDLEACHWMTRAIYLYALAKKRGIKIDNYLEKLVYLGPKYQPDNSTLTYFNDKYFTTFLFTLPFSKEGMVPFHNKSKYGYMNEKGKVVIEPIYGRVLPFNNNGLAAVIMNGKYGFINKNGDFVIQPKYNLVVYNFHNDHTFALDEDQLLLLDSKGNILKNLGNGYNGMGTSFVLGRAYVHHKSSNLWHVYDSNGEFLSTDENMFNDDYLNGVHFFIDSDGKRHDSPFEWR